MSTKTDSNVSTSVAESSAARKLSIAVIGPDERLRREVMATLAQSHEGEVREFPSYPPGLDDLPHLLELRHDIIMVELDSRPEYALDVMEGICAAGGSTVVVYSSKTDPETSDPDLLMRCMRVGAREFLSPPFRSESIQEALFRAAARRPVALAAGDSHGRLFVFCGTKGGAGVTAITCSFAMALARESGKSTLLIDLDVPLGDTAINLGLSPQYSTLDALQNASRLDASFLSRLVVKHPSGLSVLAAPGTYSIYLPSSEAIGRLLQVARSEFEHVVVDAGSKLDAMGSGVHWRDASTIYLVTQAGIPELRNANRLMAQYQSADGPKVEVVLNRWESRGSRISEEDMKKALTRAAAWKIPNDYNAVRRMQDTAAPFTAADSTISWQIDQMARSACGLPETPPKKKIFSLLGRGRQAPVVREPEADGSAGLMRLGLLGAQESEEATVAAAQAAERAVARETEAVVPQGPTVHVFNGQAYRRGGEGFWQTCERDLAEVEIPTVTWPVPPPLVYGEALSPAHLHATASSPGTFVYTPAAGLVLPAGKHTVWATFVPGGNTQPAVITAAQVTVHRARPVIIWDRPAAICYGTELGPAQLNARTSLPGTFAYRPEPEAVLAVGTHSLRVQFKPADEANYEEAEAEVTLTVTKAPTTLRWSEPAPLVYGVPLGPLQLHAVAAVPGSLTYTPAEGTVLPAGCHTLLAEFSPADAANHTEARAEVQLTVGKATPTVLWPASPTLTYGTPLSRAELNATSPVAGSFVYVPGEGSVPGAGRHILRAQFTPSDAANYNPNQACIPLTVAKMVPVLHWKATDPVEYGTTLGDAELCAEASIPGVMTYEPQRGTSLVEGLHTLAATFTPLDETNYATATASVPLLVNPARPVAICWPDPQDISFGTQLGAAQLCARAEVEGAWNYVPGAGEVLPAGRHTLRATFTPADINRPAAQATVELTVHKGRPLIQWIAPQPILYGTALRQDHLRATASVAGTFHYLPGAGTLLPAGNHTLTARFVPADEKNVEPAEAEVVLTVTKAVPAITWAAPGPLEYGSALHGMQLNATSPVEGTFHYAPAPGTVLAPGCHRLSVSLMPADRENYAVAQASVPLTVHDGVTHAQDEDSGEQEGDAVPMEGALARELVGCRSGSCQEESSPAECIDSAGSRKLLALPVASLYGDSDGEQSAPAHHVADAEIRTYRGGMYRREPDGQWHLVLS